MGYIGIIEREFYIEGYPTINSVICKVIDIYETDETVLVEYSLPDNDNIRSKFPLDDVSVLYDISSDMYWEKENYYNKYGKEEFLKKYSKKDILEFPCCIANIKFESIKDLEDYIKRHHEKY